MGNRCLPENWQAPVLRPYRAEPLNGQAQERGGGEHERRARDLSFQRLRRLRCFSHSSSIVRAARARRLMSERRPDQQVWTAPVCISTIVVQTAGPYTSDRSLPVCSCDSIIATSATQDTPTMYQAGARPEPVAAIRAVEMNEAEPPNRAVAKLNDRAKPV